MKTVKITAEELNDAQAWLKQIDYTVEDVPMLLASYARDVKIEKFPALLNLSDGIDNLAEKIGKIGFYDTVIINTKTYNELIKFKMKTISYFEKILGKDNHFIRVFDVDESFEKIIKMIENDKPVEINRNSNIKFFGGLLVVFSAGIILQYVAIKMIKLQLYSFEYILSATILVYLIIIGFYFIIKSIKD